MTETFEQWFEKRMTSPDEWEQAKTYDWLKDCWHARDAEIQALRAEIERLKRPEMVRELPRVGGWYWRAGKGLSNPEAVLVRIDLGGRPYLQSDNEDESLIIYTVLKGYYWSAKPIEPDAMPERGRE